MDTDHHFEIREAETEILKEFKDYSTKHVTRLGGGIVETPAARDVLKAYSKEGPVVHIMRNIEEIDAYIGAETARPAYGEPIEDVYNHRAPWYAGVCNYEFSNNAGSGPDPKVVQEVSRFFKHVTGQSPNHPPNLAQGKKSYFLSLTYPDIKLALPHIDEITTGADALELRVDLKIRSIDKIGPYIPFKAYVVSQPAEAFELFDLPVRAGVEWRFLGPQSASLA